VSDQIPPPPPPLLRASLTRTCRYGHGELRRVAGVLGQQLTFAVPVSPPWPVRRMAFDPKVMTEELSTVPLTYYAVALYVCPFCGYLEMFDESRSR